MKPPNIKPVYPVRFEGEQTLITPDMTKKGPVIIFNSETLDPRSLLYSFADSANYLERIFAQLQKYTNANPQA